ncbi:MAG: 4-oxalocrotonate tautomerase [Acidimicrobiaceae bacterium]|nr:4-oxalocrotonate tautomerase [Acidimicrobiaceae bacterium]
MPIITVKVIKGVVLTSDEQKRDLLKKMTDTFISVVGDVARPYTYCIIEETPLYEWSIGGQPLPDLPFLYGPEYAEMHRKANEMMKAYTESLASAPAAAAAASAASVGEPAGPTPAGGFDEASQAAQDQWATGKIG